MRYYILQVQREPFTRQGGGLALYNAQRAVERGFHGQLAAAAQRVLGTAGGVRLAYYIIMVVKGHALRHSGVICLRWNRGRSPANGSERRETILSGECLCQLQNVG